MRCDRKCRFDEHPTPNLAGQEWPSGLLKRQDGGGTRHMPERQNISSNLRSANIALTDVMEQTCCNSSRKILSLGVELAFPDSVRHRCGFAGVIIFPAQSNSFARHRFQYACHRSL
jgi:hypothetical protein